MEVWGNLIFTYVGKIQACDLISDSWNEMDSFMCAKKWSPTLVDRDVEG